ncbi:efflux RND transporter permease subunit [Haloarchaeobius iranensis]|uniref:Predicted exporter protein, RND superfamily n=1 Tax=Haloarchaeobius iranensis TaxID=996166 RepID=A0A1H0AJ78_9EURY|nr:MMPL family transporter [Haloarchaeobius iranensis]SDN33173.1 Predicted exporter protein, RND superfamily [Haloarchaeobius iranensis]
MSRDLSRRYADALVSRSRLVVFLLVVATVLVGAGAAFGTDGADDTGATGVDSAEQAALDEIRATYGADDALVTQIVVRDGNVLTRDSLLQSLRLQRAIRENDSIDPTLRTEAGVVGPENVIATAAYVEARRASNGTDRTGEPPAPTLDQQIAALESRSTGEVEALLERVLDPETRTAGREPTSFLPTDYEPGTTRADARVTFVFQSPEPSDGTPEEAYAAQVAIDSLVDERFEDGFVFGQGIVDDASSRAIGDSFLVIAPAALVLLLVALGLAYRDVVDVLVGLFGVGVVLVWLQGVQGWLGIPSSSILIAVPFLLVGLSIDYSLHVVMRYREARTGDGDAAAADGGVPEPASAMRVGIGGVVGTLATAAFTTGVGFLSNYGSPLASIRDFAVLSALGIVAMFVVFAALVPAVKVEVERLLVRLGRDREQRAFGADSGPVKQLLSWSAVLSRRLPAVVLAAALLLAAGGAYGTTALDTEFNQADFLPEDAPEWMESLPEPFAPTEYDVREDLSYLSENFRQRGEGSTVQVLLHGNLTDPAVLEATDGGSLRGSRYTTVTTEPDGTVAVESPSSVLRAVAARNETVAAAVADRDSDGDGLPDRDVGAIYDLVYTAAPEQASSVLHRTADGSYSSARMTVGVRGDASSQSVARDGRRIADVVEGTAPVTAVATGTPVVTAVVQSALFETLAQGFVVTLGVILTFLAGLYWWRHRTPGLAVVVVLPVVAALAWLLGAMAILDIPFNSETVVITGLAIGLGVDYSIHLTDRFVEERERQASLERALTTAATGTGGALLGSAATTAAGFGVLALALSPPLHRFGLVTGLSIVFAFVSCLTVLPSLLVLRDRFRHRTGP